MLYYVITVFFLYFLGESPENDGLLKVLIVAISGFGG